MGGTPFQSTYGASKIATECWADALHREVMVKGMHVSILQLGVITTPMLKKQADTLGPDVQWEYDAENYPHEQSWWEAYFALLIRGNPPTKTSDAIVHAIRAERPARRYLAGFGSEFMRITPRLPCSFLDQCFDGKLIRAALPCTEDD